MPKVNEEQQDQVNQSQPLATERSETLRAAQGVGQSCVAGEDEEAGRCEVEWEGPKRGLCNPHRCDLLEGHTGKHICDCGWTRRFMKRDAPEQNTEGL